MKCNDVANANEEMMFHHEGNDLRVTRNNRPRVPAPLSPNQGSGYSLPYPCQPLPAVPPPVEHAASACIPSSTFRVTRNTLLKTGTIDILGTLSSEVAPPPTTHEHLRTSRRRSYLSCHTESRPRDPRNRCSEPGVVAAGMCTKKRCSLWNTPNRNTSRLAPAFTAGGQP